MYLAGILLSCGAALFWALGPVFLKKGLSYLDHAEMTAVRTLGFLGASLVFCLADPEATVVWRYPPYLLSFVLLNIIVGNIIGDLCYFRSLELIGVSRAVGTTSSYPLFVAAISFFWLGESLTLPLVLGILVMMAGLLLLKAGADRTERGENVPSPWKGFLFALAAAACWALMMVLQKWLLSVHNLPAASITFWRAVFLSFVSWSFWKWRWIRHPEKRGRLLSAPLNIWVYATAAGIFGLAAGGYSFALAIQLIPVSVATPITASSPILAAAMGVFFFHESMRPVQWAGILCILGGVLAVST